MDNIRDDSPANSSHQPENTLPFNLDDALAGKPVIHEYKRTKAVQVIHVTELPQARNVLVVFEDGEYDFFTRTGQSADGCVRLWMERTGAPVPFTVAGWKKGWKTVYRDGTFPREVHVFETAAEETLPVISVPADGKLLTHRADGAYLAKGIHYLDLLLIPPVTP